MDGSTSQVPYLSCKTLLNPPEMSLFVAMVTASSSELRVSQFITCNDTLLVETYQLTRCRNRKKEAKKIAQHAYYCPVGTSETLMAKYGQIYKLEEGHSISSSAGLFWRNQPDFEAKKDFFCFPYVGCEGLSVIKRLTWGGGGGQKYRNTPPPPGLQNNPKPKNWKLSWRTNTTLPLNWNYTLCHWCVETTAVSPKDTVLLFVRNMRFIMKTVQRTRRLYSVRKKLLASSSQHMTVV